MDVLHVNKFYYPYVGGIESVVKTLAEGTEDAGHEVRVLATADKGLGSSRCINGVKIKRTSSFGTVSSVPLSPSFPLRYAQMATQTDIVHHHLPNPLSVISHLLSNPSVTTVATYHSDIIRQKRAMSIYNPLLSTFLRQIDHIFVTSQPILEESPHLQEVRSKCTVTPLSIDPDQFAPGSDGSTMSRFASSDDDIILFVGRLNYYKGVEYLLDAMPDIDAQLLIVGDGSRRSALEDTVEQLGIASKVQFLGEVSGEELHHCYQAADIFVLPSTEPSEAFGVVQLEAMAYETPVINTDLPTGVPWVSRDGETGITVPPEDSDAISEAVNELLADPERRRKYGAAARSRVLQNFTDDQLIAETVSTYQDLLE